MKPGRFYTQLQLNKEENVFENQLEKFNVWKPWNKETPIWSSHYITDVKNSLAQEGFSLFPHPRLDSSDTETWLWGEEVRAASKRLHLHAHISHLHECAHG